MAHRIHRSSALRSSVRVWLAFLVIVPLMSACNALEYDLASVPVPISAKPDTSTGGTRAEFRIETKAILWVHGVFGRSNPDVTALVTDAAKGYDRIAGFRVTVSGGFHDWLIAHLTGTLVRMKSVVIEGQLLKGGDPAPR